MRCLFWFLFSFVTSAESDTAVETTAMDLDYRIDAFECGDDLRRLSKEDKQKKKINKVYRICFEPNGVARGAGVGIKKVDSWTWETSHDNGMAVLEAAHDGEGLGGISAVECQEGGKLCYLDTYLTTGFYHNPGTVSGKGEVSFTTGTGSVPVELSLFTFDFTVKLKDGPDGKEVNAAEAAAIFKDVNAHNDAVQAQKNDENTDEVKEEL
jgi:hypothetical protein